MNEFDELFDNNTKPDVKKQEQGLKDFDSFVNKSEKNGLLLAAYIIVSLLFSFGLQLVYNNMFPDETAITDSFIIVNEVEISVSDNDDENYPYLYTITGNVQNGYTEDLPLMYIDMVFKDADGNEIAYYYYQDEDIAKDGYFSINETLESNITYDTFEVTYGFDLSPSLYTLFNLLPVLFSAVLFFWIDWENFKFDAREFKKDKKKFILQIISGFIMVYASLLAANVILQLLGVSGTSQNEMTISSMFTESPVQLIMLFFLLCVFTPIVEEIVFRKVIYTFVEPKFGYKIAIIATGVIFGLMHVIAYGDFIQSIPYIFMGLTFGYIYWRANKNIYVTIGVHFLNNFLSYMVYFLFIVFGISI